MLIAAYEDNVTFLASALTFDAFLAALPFALILLSAVGFFVHTGAQALEDVLGAVSILIPSIGTGAGDPFRQAESLLTSLAESRGQLSALGIPLFLWFSTRFFSGARVALNDVFDTRETRSWFVGKSVDLFLVIATVALVMANAVVTYSVVNSGWLGRFAATVSAYSLGVVLFFIVYAVAPTRRARWDTALIAAAATSLGFEIGKKLFTLYIAEFTRLDRLSANANVVALLLLVLWMYYMALVFLIGAEVAETYDLRRRQTQQRMILE